MRLSKEHNLAHQSLEARQVDPRQLAGPMRARGNVRDAVIRRAHRDRVWAWARADERDAKLQPVQPRTARSEAGLEERLEVVELLAEDRELVVDGVGRAPEPSEGDGEPL